MDEETTEPVVEIVSPDAESEMIADQVAGFIKAHPEIVLREVQEYFRVTQIDYARRISEIEAFLGFAESSEALGTRLHRLESFVGIKG